MNPSANRIRKPKQKIVIPERVAERAATRWEPEENGCWISTYSVASHGYAQVGWKGVDRIHAVTAHRAAWVHFNGKQIPEGFTIDHLCKQRRCVNPEHLRVLSNFENARRTSGRDWKLGECAHGHPNSLLRPRGKHLECLECSREWQRRYRAKKRLERAA